MPLLILRERPRGTLKLTAGPEFGVLAVNEWIATYLKLYPDMIIDAEFTNRITDVIHEGFDIAIRIGALADSELSARKIGEIEYAFYASPHYLVDRGTPSTPNDLSHHDLVGFAPRGKPQWRLVNGLETMSITPNCRYVVNNTQSVLGMTIDNVGVSLLPKFMAEPATRKGQLKRILNEWEPIPVPVHAVFASNRYMAPKVRAFVDLAVKMFNDNDS